jgi:hypothetical protein
LDTTCLAAASMAKPTDFSYAQDSNGERCEEKVEAEETGFSLNTTPVLLNAI